MTSSRNMYYYIFTIPWTILSVFQHVYVVVGISNSVLSILMGNFPVRIEKKVCMIVLNLTGMFPVNIKKNCKVSH